MEVSGQTFAYFRPRSSLEALALHVFYQHTNIVEAHGQLAAENQQTGDIDGALREYRAMIEIFPYDIKIYRSAAWLALNNNRLDDALPVLLRVIRIRPTAEASRWIGQIYLQRNELPQAARYLEQSRLLDMKNNAHVLSLLKGIYMQTGEQEKIRGLGDRPPVPSAPDMSKGSKGRQPVVPGLFPSEK